jgi:NitT/TauT family transport system substrate-binding protein
LPFGDSGACGAGPEQEIDPQRREAAVIGLRAKAVNRRDFLAATCALSASAVLGSAKRASAEPLPEVKKIRLPHTGALCLAPQYVAEELLKIEGFSTVEYVQTPYTGGAALTKGGADISMDYAPALVRELDEGPGLIALSGVHSGCYAIVANQRVRTFRDLKGKRIAISAMGAGDHVFMASLLAYVGVDPKTQVEWVRSQSIANNLQSFLDGGADAFLAFPPQPQKLKEMGLGRVIVDGTHDRPWSQYLCCVVAGSRDFVTKYPVATKRALRAILKAADLCADDPERVARIVVAKGFEPRYAVALESFRAIPYRAWRELNVEDALRFHALRLHEAGLIASTAQKIIAQGSDWRFLNELKRELKA